tara:strand:+ start:548 stop:2557 length:2010 start_codon:yes stop_codon:yes gene_type:complete
MADANIVLKADSRQVQQATRNLDKMRGSLGGLGTAARLAAGALVGIGIGKFGKSVIDVGRQVENLQTRFKFLFGSAEEGAKAFDTLSKFAGTVPFTLEEIAAASGNLAVVSKDAEALGKNLELTANVAAISGLDFRLAGEQIQRALSGGISAADLLRERGIKALLGFKDGVKVTAKETQEAFDRVFGPDGEFGGAASALATNLDGLQSMVQDKFFNIRKIISESGPFDRLKAIVGTLDKALTDNFANIEKAAQGFGQAIVDNFEKLLIGTAVALDALKPVTDFLQRSFNNIVTATNSLPGYIKALGVIGFLALGIKGKLVVAVIGAIFDKVVDMFAGVIDFIARQGSKIAGVMDALGMDETAAKLQNSVNKMSSAADKLRKKFKQTGDTTEDTTDEIGLMIKTLDENEDAYDGNLKKMLLYIKSLREMELEQAAVVKKVDETREKLKKENEQLKDTTTTIQKYRDALGKVFDEAQEKFNGITEAVKLTTNLFSTMKRGIGDAFADALLGARSLKESLGDLARNVLRQLISGLIQIGLQVFVFDVLAQKIRNARNETDKLTSALKRQALIKAAMSFIPGGSFFGGFFADGGRIQSNQFGVVGEAGPEIVAGPANVTPLEDVAGGGSTNVTFNISTIDATDFDTLLTTRQELILGLINRGLAERGKRSLTA